VYKALRGRLEASGQWRFWAEEWWPLLPAVVAMQARGLPIDMAEQTRLRRRFRGEVRLVDGWICGQAGHPIADTFDPDRPDGFNPNSDTQIRRWLFGCDKGEPKVARGESIEVKKGVLVPCCGLKPATKTVGGAWSVDKDALTRVLRDMRKMDEPFRLLVLALLHRCRFVKLDEYLTFDHEGGRLYPTIKMAGTETLRFAYADPALHSWAKEIRSIVKPLEGTVFVKADFSQLEARLAAYLSGDQADIAVYERTDAKPHPHHPEWDIHSRLIVDGLAIPIAKWLSMPDDERTLFRDAAKNIRYGTFQYGGEPESAQAKVRCPCGSDPSLVVPWTRCQPNRLMDLSPTVKRQIVDGWRSSHTAFVRWQKRIADEVSRTHRLTNPLGLRRQFLQPKTDDLIREAYAWSVSSVASIIKLRALRRLHAKGAPVVFDHHDAIMCETPAEEAPQVARMMQEAMEAPVPELGMVQFPVDVEIAGEWH
jgi:hypothetical protein